MASSFGVRAGKAFVELSLQSRVEAGLRSAEKRLQNFARRTQQIGRQLFGAGAAIAAPLAVSLRTFATFADQMSELKGITGATADEFDRLYDQAKKLGSTTSFTATEVGGAQTELGRAGFKPAEIEAATEGVLNLAKATGTELPEAATIAGNTLRAFGMEASEAGRVTDVLTATANNSAQGVGDLFEALKMVAPIASDAGSSLEETAAAVGMLANNGIKGSAAGTSLRSAYLRLADPKIRKAVKDLTGVDATDAAGNMRPLATVIEEIGKKTKDLPTGERLAAFNVLFGKIGVSGASALAKSGAAFDDLLGKLTNADGLAKKTAETMDDNLGGSFRKLMSATEGVQIAIGEALEGDVRSFLDSITEAAGGVSAFIGDNQELVTKAAAVAAGLLGAGSALIGFSLAASVASFAIGGLATGVGLLAGGATILAGGALFTALIGGFDATAESGEAAFGRLKDTGSRAWDGIVARIAAGDMEGAIEVGLAAAQLMMEDTVGAFFDEWEPFLDALKEGWKESTKLGRDAWSSLVNFTTETWSAFAEFMADSNSNGADDFGTTWQSAITAIADQFLVLEAAAESLSAHFDSVFDHVKNVSISHVLSKIDDPNLRDLVASTISSAEAGKAALTGGTPAQKQAGILNRLANARATNSEIGAEKETAAKDRLAAARQKADERRQAASDRFDAATSSQPGQASVTDDLAAELDAMLNGDLAEELDRLLAAKDDEDSLIAELDAALAEQDTAKAAEEAASVAVRESQTTTGTFSTRAAGRIGASSVMERVAAAAETTNDLLGQIAENTDEGMGIELG